MYVAIDKFTKWPEVEVVRKVMMQSAIKFFKGLVCRFGVPKRIITDNNTQFTSHAFMQYIEDLGSKVYFASVAHPRSNGQAERANAEVLQGLRMKAFDRLCKSEGAGLTICRQAAKLSHRLDTLCPGIRGRSSSPCGTHIRVTLSARL